jgi:hypothetical protein
MNLNRESYNNNREIIFYKGEDEIPIDYTEYPIPIFTVDKSLDFIDISIKNGEHKECLQNMLVSSGFKCVATNKLNKGKYCMSKTYKSDNDSASFYILYDRKHEYVYCPDFIIKIHDPNREIINLFTSFLHYHGINHGLSTIEMTFDFYVDNHERFQHILCVYLYAKNRKTKPLWIKDTFYTGDMSKAKSTANRLYIKGIAEGKKVVRLELILKQQKIKELGLALPLTDIDQVDIANLLNFMQLDMGKIACYQSSSCKKQIKSYNKKKLGYGSLIKRMNLNWLDTCIIRKVREQPSFMEKIQFLKNMKSDIPSYNRYLIPFYELNNEFFEQIAKQHFLKLKSLKLAPITNKYLLKRAKYGGK